MNDHQKRWRGPFVEGILSVGLCSTLLQSGLAGCGQDSREIENMAAEDAAGGSSGLDSDGGESLEGESAGTTDTGDEAEADSGQEEGSRPPVRANRGIDLLFVIDNSGSTGEEQGNLARNFPRLVRKLIELGEGDEWGEFGGSDVQIMVTTTDMGNPICSTEFHKPEKGHPVTTSCVDRLKHFTYSSPGSEDVVREEACTDLCKETIELEEGAPFIAFQEGGTRDNIATELEVKDIDGDGLDDSPAAQALACIGPQGIDGCGMESPLEAMRSALDPEAEWNQGSKPFVRPGALLAVAIITDEADCSVADESIMTDPQYMEDFRDEPRPSSAICWNAGVECDDDPDMPGHKTACRSVDNGALHSVDRYKDFLINDLLKERNKEVVMLGILGVPEVTKRSEEEPRVPVEGGVHALQYRDWVNAEYPEGDILPEFWPERDADYFRWAFKSGPGCTGVVEKEGGEQEFIGQAIPPVRIREVCQALDDAEQELNPDEPHPRCCIESICDDDFSPAIDCLVGLIKAVPDGPI